MDQVQENGASGPSLLADYNDDALGREGKIMFNLSAGLPDLLPRAIAWARTV